MKFKDFSVHLDVKELSSDDNTIKIEGWANKFLNDSGEVLSDRDGEAVLPFGMDIEDFKKNPIILYQHRKDEPVGKCTDISLSDKGIYVTCEIYKELHPVAFAAAKRGVLKSFSIGFKVMDAVYDTARDVWLLMKTSLFEISMVSIGANQLSQFTIVKSADGTPMLARRDEENEEKQHSKLVIQKISDLSEEVKELRKLIEEKSEELVVTLEETTQPAVVETTLTESENKEEIVDIMEQKAPPTLDEQLNEVLSNISPENFDTIYTFHASLTDKLNELVTSAITQSQN